MPRAFVFAATAVALLPALDAPAGYVFWTDRGSVYRAGTDGSDVRQIYAGDAAAGRTNYVEVDPVAGKLYSYGFVGPWYGPSSGYVRRSDLDGGNVEDVITSGLQGQIYGFAIDAANRTMYLGGHGAGAGVGLRRANLDGTGLTDLAPDPYYAHDIVADPEGGHLYYTNAVDYEGVRRSSLDGTGVTDLIGYGGSSVSSYLALDRAAGTLYHARPDTGQIIRTGLDGAGPQVLLSGLTGLLDVEVSGGNLYFATSTGIIRSHLDGSGAATVVAFGPGGPLDFGELPGGESLAVFSGPVVPEPGTLALMATGGACLAAFRRRRRPETPC